MEVLREFAKDVQNYIEINSILDATLETSEVLSLHLARKDAYSPEKKGLIIADGLRTLATKLKTDHNLRLVKEIVAMSWIVTEYPRVMEGLGFEVEVENHPLAGLLRRKYKWNNKPVISDVKPEHRHTKPSLAVISKEKFLQRYGP